MDEKKQKLELVGRDRNSIVSSILVDKIYDDGTILSINNRYVKVFRISDINYKLSDNKKLLDEAYKNVLNSTDKNIEISLIINSKKLSKKFLDEKVLLKYQNDNYNYLRDGINETINKNSSAETLIKDKYLTIAFTDERKSSKYETSVKNRMNLNGNI